MKRGRKAIGMIFFLVATLFLISIVSAGVGIKWDRETYLVYQNERTCVNYSVYNPWPDETSATITVSDNIKEILLSQEAEVKSIPAQTSSENAIPLQFCFEVPQVYQKDCLVGSMICEQKCEEPQKVYSGEILATEGGSLAGGGSAATMSVSAPLTLKVVCTPYNRNFTLVFVVIAIIAVLGIIYYYMKKKKAKKNKQSVPEAKQDKVLKSQKKKK
jgi:hypothetical protein